MFSKVVFGPVIAVLLLGAGFSAWTMTRDGGEAPGGAVLPRSVVIGVGDSVELPDGAVLTYVAVEEDSRCPADAMCVWQGQALLAFALDGEAFQVMYGADADGADADGAAAAGDYTLTVEDVQPYPLASQPYDPADSEVTVTVSEGK